MHRALPLAALLAAAYVFFASSQSAQTDPGWEEVGTSSRATDLAYPGPATATPYPFDAYPVATATETPTATPTPTATSTFTPTPPPHSLYLPSILNGEGP